MVPDPETFQTRYETSVSNKLNIKQNLVFSTRGVCPGGGGVLFFFSNVDSSCVSFLAFICNLKESP